MSQPDINGTLTIKNVKKNFVIDNKKMDVLSDINLAIEQGEFISIVGVSGCGKSTLLKIIAGIVKATSGEVMLDKKIVSKPTIDCGMIFQESRLYPWLRTEDNIKFGISKKITKEEKKKLINEHIELVGLIGFEKAFPNQLSGGMPTTC